MSEPILLTFDQVASYETRLRPILAGAGSRFNYRYSVDDTLGFAKRDIWQLWIGEEDGEILYVGGTELVVYPSGLKSLLVKFIAGRKRELWQHHLATVLRWAKLQGCTMAEGICRKGWKRILPGWTHSYDYLEIKL